MKFERFDLEAFEAGDASAEKLDRICRETGFLILEGHGVADKVVSGIWDAMRSFFALSAEEKAQVKAPRPGYPYGYFGSDVEALAKSKGEDTPPDLKESFNGGPLSVPDGADAEAMAFCYQPTIWPELDGFREAWETYYAAQEALAARIMRAFAAALKLPAEFFTPFIDAPISALRALHYPATIGQPMKKQQRAGAHTDYGSLTILLPQPGSQGLQIMSPRGDWVDVPAPEGCFVINIGDLMARWTADRWVSTLHRVVAKPHQPERFSLAFFHQPNWSAVISPLDGSDAYPPVRSGKYLMGKFQKATE